MPCRSMHFQPSPDRTEMTRPTRGPWRFDPLVGIVYGPDDEPVADYVEPQNGPLLAAAPALAAALAATICHACNARIEQERKGPRCRACADARAALRAAREAPPVET